MKLAKLAGIRPETLNRPELGKHIPSMETINKIDRALNKAGRKKDEGTGKVVLWALGGGQGAGKHC